RLLDPEPLDDAPRRNGRRGDDRRTCLPTPRRRPERAARRAPARRSRGLRPRHLPAAHPRLGLKPLHAPACAGALVPEPVVQPVVAVLPELVRLGGEAVAAPARGPRRLVPQPCHAQLELLAARDRRALLRHGGALPRAQGPRRPVGVALLRADSGDRALDPDLAPGP